MIPVTVPLRSKAHIEWGKREVERLKKLGVECKLVRSRTLTGVKYEVMRSTENMNKIREYGE